MLLLLFFLIRLDEGLFRILFISALVLFSHLCIDCFRNNNVVIITSVMKSNASNNTSSAYAIVLYDLLSTMQRMRWNIFTLIPIFNHT